MLKTRKYLMLILAILISLNSLSFAAIPGDADNDGKLDMADIIFSLQTLAGLRPTGPAPPLSSIVVTPGNSSTPMGFGNQLKAIGTYSEGTSKDITTQVTWTSSNTSTAVVNNSGLSAAISPGTVTITATSGDISGNTIFTVTPASTLSYLNLSPTQVVGTVGADACCFNTYGTFANNATGIIPGASCSWSSGSPNVISVNQGLIHCNSVGGYSIYVTCQGLNAEGSASCVSP